MAVTADRVVVELQAKLDRYKRQLAEGDRKFEGHMGSMRRQAGLTETKNTQSFNRIGDSADKMSSRLRKAASALALAGGAVAGVRVLASFEQAMSTVQAITQATGGDFENLEAKARELGSTTRFSATQAAEGMLFLARAGFSTDEVLASIEGTLQLAQAGNLDLGRAADIASNALSGFNLGAEESARIVDVLAAASNAANTDINQLGEALKFAAPTAVALGIDVEETVAIIGKLSDAGIQAGLAGRGFQALGTQFENNRDKIEALIGSYDLAEDGLANVISRLDKAGITTKQIIDIFRAENLDVFTVLSNAASAGAGGVEELQGKLEDAGGTASRISKIMDDNLNGALLNTKSRLEELVLALGEAGATDALIQALEMLQELLVLAAENADLVIASITALTIRALLPMATAIGGKVIASVTALQAELVVLNAIAGRSTTAIQTFTAVAGRLAVALGPYALAISAVAAAWGVMAASGRDAEASIRGTQEALRKYEAVNQDIKSDLKELRDLQDDLTQAIGNQRPAIEATKRADIAALEERIAKNRELAGVLEAQARAELANAQNGAGVITPNRAQSLLGRGAFEDETQTFQTPGGGTIERLRIKPQEELNALLEEEVSRIQDIHDAGGQLTSQQRDILNFYAERRTTAYDIAALKERIALFQNVRRGAGSDGGADVNQLLGGGIYSDFEGGSGSSGSDSSGSDKDRERAVEDAKAALKELENAFKTTYQIERDEAAQTYAAQLKAIKTLGIEGDERRKKELQAEIAYRDEVDRIDAEEEADAKQIADEKADRQKNAADREIDLLNQVLDARDRLSGRYFAIMEREFERKRDLIQDEIEDEERKNEALIALAQERALAERDIRDRIAGRGEYSQNRDVADISTAQRVEQERTQNVDDQLGSDLSELQSRYEEERALLQEDQEAKLALERGYLEERAALEEEAAGLRKDITLESMAAQAQAVENGLGNATAAMEKAFNKQSGIYKAFFLLQKGAAIAAAAIATQQNISEASKAGFPQNIALMAAAAAQGATILANIKAIQATFGGGRERGGPVSPDEFYEVNEKGKPELLRQNGKYYLMSGGHGDVEPAQDMPQMQAPNADVLEAQLARINQPVNVSPEFVTSGGRSISVGGSTLQVQGNVTDDAVPRLEAAMNRMNRDMENRIERVIERDRMRTTPRHQRDRFLKM